MAYQIDHIQVIHVRDFDEIEILCRLREIRGGLSHHLPDFELKVEIKNYTEFFFRVLSFFFHFNKEGLTSSNHSFLIKIINNF